MVRLIKDIPVACNVLDGAIIHLQRNVESNHAVALFDDFQDILRYIGKLGSTIKEEFNLFEESGLVMLILLGSIK